MSSESDLRALLLATPSISSLVGTRISVDRIEEGSARPFIVFTRSGTERSKGLDGTVHGLQVTFDVQCWAESRAAAELLADAVQTAIETSFQNVADRSGEYDAELDLEAAMLTVQWWE